MAIVKQVSTPAYSITLDEEEATHLRSLLSMAVVIDSPLQSLLDELKGVGVSYRRLWQPRTPGDDYVLDVRETKD